MLILILYIRIYSVHKRKPKFVDGVCAMFCCEWGLQKMKKAERFEEMIGVFNSLPLNQDNFDDFYVDTSRIRSVINARSEIINTLKYGINPYTKILLMGHKGSGKSTEMVKISEELKDQYEIINFSIAQEVELIGIQYIDVIFAVMSQIIEYLSSASSVMVKTDILDKLTDYWKKEITLEIVKDDFAGAEACGKAELSFLKRISVYGKGVFKTGTETKKSIRKSIEPKISYLIALINEVLEDLNKQLRENGGKELLIVIEDLDKLDIADAKHLFVEHRKTLLSLHLKMIFSFPIYMAYTAEFGMINDDFDKYVLYSMIKVNNSDRTRNEEGISILKEIVYKRMNPDLVSNSALEYMIMKSGGAIRDLFTMLVDCAILELTKEKGDQPAEITDEDAQIVAKRLKSTYERYITSPEQFDRLVEIYNDPHPENTDEVLSELLKTLSVIEYNGERWCGVHPVLVDFLKEKGRI